MVKKRTKKSCIAQARMSTSEDVNGLGPSGDTQVYSDMATTSGLGFVAIAEVRKPTEEDDDDSGWESSRPSRKVKKDTHSHGHGHGDRAHGHGGHGHYRRDKDKSHLRRHKSDDRDERERTATGTASSSATPANPPNGGAIFTDVLRTATGDGQPGAPRGLGKFPTGGASGAQGMNLPFSQVLRSKNAVGGGSASAASVAVTAADAVRGTSSAKLASAVAPSAGGKTRDKPSGDTKGPGNLDGGKGPAKGNKEDSDESSAMTGAARAPAPAPPKNPWSKPSTPATSSSALGSTAASAQPVPVSAIPAVMVSQKQQQHVSKTPPQSWPSLGEAVVAKVTYIKKIRGRETGQQRERERVRVCVYIESSSSVLSLQCTSRKTCMHLCMPCRA